MSGTSDLVKRRLSSVLEERIGESPVVLIEGPRSVGKSTLLRQVAAQHNADVLDLDREDIRTAASRDPEGFISSDSLVCIDEYQKAPLLLDAIKARLNADGRFGQFLLAGSTRHEALPPGAQALTGRLQRLPIYPLSQGELMGKSEVFLKNAFENPEQLANQGSSHTSRDEYIDRIVAGGFPITNKLNSIPARNRWFREYVSLSLTRDVGDISNIRRAPLLPTVLQKLASQNAQVLNVTRMAESAAIDRATATDYIHLLEDLFLIRQLQPWGTTSTQRVAGRPKIHVLDSGVAAWLLRLSAKKLSLRDPSVLTEFGHLVESFAVMELLKQASWMEEEISSGHWRTKGGDDEVDIVLERHDGAVVAVEIKAGTRITGDDLAPMAKLRDRLGKAFSAGIAFYLGERSYRYDDRLFVLPLDRLWLS